MLYKNIEDLQGTSWCLNHVANVKDWRELAIGWAESDEFDGAVETLKVLPEDEVIDYIADFWQLDIVPVLCYHHKDSEGDSAQKDCEEYADYELDTCDGETIHVCEKHDKMYTACEVCGKQGIWDGGYGNMSKFLDSDDWPTCFLCQDKIKAQHPTLSDCVDYEVLKAQLTPVELDYAEKLCFECENATADENGDYSCGCQTHGEDDMDVNKCHAYLWLGGCSTTEDFIEYVKEICVDDSKESLLTRAVELYWKNSYDEKTDNVIEDYTVHDALYDASQDLRYNLPEDEDIETTQSKYGSEEMDDLVYFLCKRLGMDTD